MPLYEIDDAGELIPFRRLRGGPQLYESELEDLFWASPDDLLGESLFLIARQAVLPNAGRVDVLALDRNGRVVVVEIKRDVDRAQLAQCLEYAGWARTTNLEELATIYQRGDADSFWRDWQVFTDSPAPVPINRSPRLVLIASEFHERTQEALDFLRENGVPVDVVPVNLYEDEQGRRFVDVEAEHEPIVVALDGEGGRERAEVTVGGRRVRVADLIEADLLAPGDSLVWDRPRLGVTCRARIADNGAIELEDGRQFASPSRAAVEAAGIPAYDGWYAWHVVERGDLLLHDLRDHFLGARSDAG